MRIQCSKTTGCGGNEKH